MLNYTDKEIIERLHKDNDEAFEFMFLKFYDRLCSYAACLIKNKNDAEEIVQDVFYEFWEKREKIDINTSLRAYLFKAVYNRSINYINFNQIRSKYVQNQLDSMNYQLTISPLSENYPIANLISQELDALISKTIFSLPDQCRKIFQLCRFEDLSYQEIALQLHISVNTVKTQMQRALKKLRETLKDYLPS